MKRINVLHINTSGLGGAAIACHRLHNLFLNYGISSSVLHLYDNALNNDNYYTLGYKRIRRVANHFIYKISTSDLTPDAYVFSEFAPLSSSVSKHELVKKADVIYLHWVVGGFLSKSDFIELAKLGKPIFCFTHDMWWITGGCHYSFDCEQYKTGCYCCPRHKYISLFSRIQARWKKTFYGRFKNIHFISPSEWMKNCIEASFVLDKGRSTHIPNVVPDSIFKKIDKKLAREMLSLPQDKIIISFGTADNSNSVKGFRYLKEALSKIDDDNIVLCIYGDEDDLQKLDGISIPIISLGKLHNQNKVALANAASDLFISPTLAESFGLTLLENIKCGTPVISTNITAVPEIVQNNVSGYLIEPKSSKELLDAIQNFISKPLIITGEFDDKFRDENIINKHLDLISKALK